MMMHVFLTNTLNEDLQPLPDAGSEPAVEELPAAEAPVEEIVVEGETQTTEQQETVVQEEPIPEPNLMPLWISLGVLGGLVLGVLAACLTRRMKKKAPAPKPMDDQPLQMQVSKLHEQGARASQQDSFALTPAELIPTHGTLAVVCDGMGGLKDGDKVSQEAVSAMVNGFLEVSGEPNQVLLALLERANRSVNRLLGPAGQRRSGTTMVAGILKKDEFHYLSVGDSRICLYRDGALFQLNREHIYVNELSTRAVNDILTLQEAWSDPQGAGLTSFLGMGDLKYVDIPAAPQKVRRGDKLILMSDGVYNALTEQELCSALDEASGADAEALGKAIADKAYDNQDNYTAVILSIC